MQSVQLFSKAWAGRLTESDFIGYSTFLSDLGSVTDPKIAVGGVPGLGCYIGKIFNWQYRTTSSSTIVDVSVSFESSHPTIAFVDAVSDFQVIIPSEDIGPAERTIAIWNSIFIVGKATGGSMGASSRSDYLAYFTSNTDHSITSHLQGMSFQRKQPAADMMPGGGYNFVFSGRLDITPKYPFAMAGLECSEDYLDSAYPDKIFSIFTFRVDTVRIGLAHRRKAACIGPNTRQTELFLHNTGAVVGAKLNLDFSDQSPRSIGFFVTFQKSPLSSSVAVEVQVFTFENIKTHVISWTTTFVHADLSKSYTYGVGNVADEFFNYDIIQAYKYKYIYLSISTGGVPTSCTEGRTDNSDTVVQGYSRDGDNYYFSKPILCKNKDDMLYPQGCKPIPVSFSNGCYEKFAYDLNTGNQRCVKCLNGYKDQVPSTPTCDYCGANCFRCENNTSCRICQKGFIKEYASGVYVCQRTVDPAMLYMPWMQSEFDPDPTVISAYPANPLIFDTKFTYSIHPITVKSMLLIQAIVEVNDAAPIDGYKRNIMLKVAGFVKQVVQVYDFPSNKVATFYVSQDKPTIGAAFDIELSSQAQFKVLSFKVKVVSYFTDRPCAFPTNSGECLICNHGLFYYLIRDVRACEVVPDDKYPDKTQQITGRPDVLLTCPTSSPIKWCSQDTPAVGLACISGFYLTGPTACTSCPGCDQCTTATNCISCPDPFVLLNIDAFGAPVDGVCQSACPSGMYPDVSRVCQFCYQTCTTCTQGAATRCTQCKSGRGFILLDTLDSSGSCWICGVDNCMACSADNVCSLCAQGYSLEAKAATTTATPDC